MGGLVKEEYLLILLGYLCLSCTDINEGTFSNCLAEGLLMSAKQQTFYGKEEKIISEFSSNTPP